ncbi:unnamed protein product [Caenorhabditis brenneri]
MKLQLILAIVCFTLYGMGYCSHASGSREKRGLSEVQKRNLIDALNKDRQEIGKKIGVKMKTMVYDPELEKGINDTSVQFCFKRFTLLLKWDSVGEEFWDAFTELNEKEGRVKPEPSRPFFDPDVTRVACSNTYHCARELNYRYFYKLPEMVGKTVEFFGKCLVYGVYEKERNLDEAYEKVEKVEDLPPISKYADIIGV